MGYRTRIVRIGNSRGLRISKTLLERSGLDGEVEIEAYDDRLVVHAVREPRATWDAAFEAAADQDPGALLDGQAVQTTFDQADWEWPADTDE